jgi:glycosyltransferase involved in cell wall biosynthesis
MPACTHVFVQSEQMRRDVAGVGIPFERMTPVPSSVNLRDLDARAGPAHDEPGGPPTIVYLGTLLRERQLNFLVRAHALVVSALPDAQLKFVGGGWMPDDEQLLRSEANRLGISRNVTITGWLPMPEAWQQVRRATLCVSPYLPVPILRSTSPTKLIEYMALAKPVVANDHPEQADVLRESGAGLVCGWNEQEFAAAIIELLLDPPRRARMGAAGRNYVAEHRTHWAMVELVLARYRKHLRASPKRPKSRLFARV